MAAQGNGPNINIKQLAQLKAHIEKLGENRKNTKSQLDAIEAAAIEGMMKFGVRYIDESGNGQGPFWVLGKQKNDGSWSTERYIEFFTMILTQVRNNPNVTPEQCAALAQQYLKGFEKRSLCLNKRTQARQKGVEDLRIWLAQGGD